MITIRPSLRHLQRGLTLLEILLATAILGIVMIAIAAAMSSMQNIWTSLRSKTDQYRNARIALDTVTSRVARATLAPRWVQDRTALEGDDPFLLESDLHFVCGPGRDLLNSDSFGGSAMFFQAPFGEFSTLDLKSGDDEHYDQLHDSLCAWGYFVEFGDDRVNRPSFLNREDARASTRRRFRLMELRQPAHYLDIFHLQSGQEQKSALSDAFNRQQLYHWFQKPVLETDPSTRPVTVVAENILAMIVLAVDPNEQQTIDLIAPDSIYDTRRFQWPGSGRVGIAAATRHRLPPMLRVTIVAMSEDTWDRMQNEDETGGRLNTMAAELRGMVSGRFQVPARFDEDMQALEFDLNRIKMPHRIVTTNVRMIEHLPP